ncbi:MAG: hypothetical protein R3288_06305 [Woeseiaceae bacterium]|nr:hypothetical protein [Woeseiaceae bacterium]
MERIAQFWDDLDDLLGIIALCAEHIRRFCLFVLGTLAFLSALAAGVTIALFDPPLAMAVATILLILLMYRSVTAGVVIPAPA